MLAMRCLKASGSLSRNSIACLASSMLMTTSSSRLTMASTTRFRGDTGDLDEILGNLADNACKFGLGQVRITARNESGATGTAPGLVLDIEDDGPGIDAAQRVAVLERGVRADTLVPGQGIGLAVVRDIVENVYGGSLEISTSSLGGARIRARLP